MIIDSQTHSSTGESNELTFAEMGENLSDQDRLLLKDIENGGVALDGVMSPLTRELKARFATPNVDMDQLWAYTPTQWVCPACQRPKADIVRPNRNGDLMCRLVEHHDHMKNLLLKTFARISSRRNVVVANEVAEKFAKRSAPMVSAYDNTVVCNDCNNADADAKKAASVHPDFSYSPGEIGMFIVAAPNKPHVVNADIALQIWKANRETFTLRLKIIERIAEIAANNEHWYQDIAPQYHPDDIRTAAKRIARNRNAHSALYVLCGPTKEQPKRDPAHWRTKGQVEIVKVPTQGEIAHVAKVTNRTQWESVPDDWHCPGCQRTKIEIIRPTKQFAWSFPLVKKSYRDLNDRSGSSAQSACDDCGHAAIHIAKEAVQQVGIEVEAYSRLVGIAEIARIVIAKPHARHRIKNREANALVKEIAERLINDPNGHQSLL